MASGLLRQDVPEEQVYFVGMGVGGEWQTLIPKEGHGDIATPMFFFTVSFPFPYQEVESGCSPFRPGLPYDLVVTTGCSRS